MSLIFALAVAIACQEKVGEETSALLADPSGLEVEQQDLTTVKLTWTDNAQGEKGYRVFLRGEGDPFTVEPLATLDPDAAEYVFTNLSSGSLYDFGVQAISSDFNLHSKTVWLNEYQIPAAEEPEQISSIVAEQEELVTIEEVVAEMEAYYDQPAQEFKETVVFAETEAVEEEPTAEIVVEAIEELIQAPETDVDCEEAVEEANTTTEATVVSGRRSKKRRS